MNSLKLSLFMNAIVLLGLIAPTAAFGQESVSKQSILKATTKRLGVERKLIANSFKAAQKRIKGKSLTAKEKKSLHQLENRMSKLVVFLLLVAGGFALWNKYNRSTNDNISNQENNNPENVQTIEDKPVDTPLDSEQDQPSASPDNSDSSEAVNNSCNHSSYDGGTDYDVDSDTDKSSSLDSDISDDEITDTDNSVLSEKDTPYSHVNNDSSEPYECPTASSLSALNQQAIEIQRQLQNKRCEKVNLKQSSTFEIRNYPETEYYQNGDQLNKKINALAKQLEDTNTKINQEINGES